MNSANADGGAGVGSVLGVNSFRFDKTVSQAEFGGLWSKGYAGLHL